MADKISYRYTNRTFAFITPVGAKYDVQINYPNSVIIIPAAVYMPGATAYVTTKNVQYYSQPEGMLQIINRPDYLESDEQPKEISEEPPEIIEI